MSEDDDYDTAGNPERVAEQQDLDTYQEGSIRENERGSEGSEEDNEDFVDTRDAPSVISALADHELTLDDLISVARAGATRDEVELIAQRILYGNSNLFGNSTGLNAAQTTSQRASRSNVQQGVGNTASQTTQDIRGARQTSQRAPTKAVSVAGTQLKMRMVPKNASVIISTTAVMFPKQERASLHPHDKNEIFDKFVKKKHGCFLRAPVSEIPLKKDPTKTDSEMEDCWRITEVLKTIKEHFIMYDVHDVFEIITSVDPFETTSLLDNVMTITTSQVAKSNRYYRAYFDAPFLEENLTISYTFVKNNTHGALLSEAMVTYSEYPAIEQGGTLLLLIILRLVISQTKEAADTLKKSFEHFKISSQDGEHIPTVMAWMKSVIERLVTYEVYPEDIVKTVLEILQTSSHTGFNENFRMLTVARRTEMAQRYGPDHLAQLTPEMRQKDVQIALELLSTASNLWRMEFKDGWNGVREKGAVFQAVDAECFNCGKKGHQSAHCPLPANESRIAANRKKFFTAKKKSKSNNDGGKNSEKNTDPKFAPPKDGEAHKKEIDGKPMFWHKKYNKWCRDKRANLSSNNQAPPSSPTDGSGQAPTEPAASAPASAPAQANTARPADMDRVIPWLTEIAMKLSSVEARLPP